MRLLILCLLFFAGHVYGYDSKQILHFVEEKLPLEGTLQQDKKGFVYVKVSDNYIYQLVEFIKDEGYEIPPYFGPGMHGAHITVMTVEESTSIAKIVECGQTVLFKPQDCQVVHPPTWPEGALVCFMTVDAPFLDELREKYSLPKTKYAFHITFGQRK